MIIVIFLLLFVYLYQMYFPVLYVPNMDEDQKIVNNNTVFLDVRDYRDSLHKPVQGAVNLPYAYLKRHHQQISSNQVVVVASDYVSKNLTVRFLKGQGFKVIGYQLIK
ncbi:hypothetical protein BKP45_12640 [Anaerobacillus alkalidiazotrophicus]|uniref:Rhodanese domain-containing protein n=1 Tax=Anaerobacillus alkalidiazotrophicus TaxID=472963 RepID=A0A1S2M6A0_9BACI|nr:hypothetical protein BKP45_18355 [Anaerobacillus alkalidiazotrophicus]OIJ20040.1 hypothetical protein BKP45_12640 [Anaerobacillus alkalidiazotrophicus]